jgi:hypothetical protein
MLVASVCSKKKPEEESAMKYQLVSLYIYIYICDLFNAAVSSADYMV